MANHEEGTTAMLTRLELFQEWRKYKNLKRDDLSFCLKQYVRLTINVSNYTIDDTLVKFIKNVDLRWKKCQRNLKTFKNKNSEWLNYCLVFPQKDSVPDSVQKSGRPNKQFEHCGLRGKQLKTKKLVSEKSLDELSFATQVQLRKAGKRTAASVLHDITVPTSPKRVHRYRRAYKLLEMTENQPIAYTADEALSLIINAKLSKYQYLLLISEAKNHNAHIYPSSNQIMEAKKKCYPEPKSVIVTENSAEIKLQNLLDITTKRICMLQEEVLKSLPANIIENTNFTLICKWGCNGSSGQSNYKQRFSEESQDDSSVFMISFVPLELYYSTPDDPTVASSNSSSQTSKVVVWKNMCPSSVRFCRAIKFIFARETLERTKQETEAVKRQISKLSPFVSDKIIVNYKLVLTMVDGKICNALTDTASSQVCYICKAKPSEMNSLDRVVKNLPTVDYYTFGLSTLHSWIRFFECCLHVSYRLDIKTWQVRGANKQQVEGRKKKIIDRFRKELGVLVDQPKPGYGSTNDGNTARIFFRDPKISSDITGVDEKIINRFGVMLRTISSGYEMDTKKFDQYDKQTAELFIEKYSWFNMPISVHKVLVHGAEVIKHAIVPIGQLSEEAQEAKNKEFKFVREHHTRKRSRVSTNEDLINYFLLSSDPIISNMSYTKNKNNRSDTFTPEVLSLLKEPNIYKNFSDTDED